MSIQVSRNKSELKAMIMARLLEKVVSKIGFDISKIKMDEIERLVNNIIERSER